MLALISALRELSDDWSAPLSLAPTATPIASYRIDRRTSLVFGLGVGIAVGFGLGIALTLGLRLGNAGVVVAGALMFTRWGGWTGMWLTVFILATTGAGRVNFMRLLEDAHRRHVLRQAGAVYQFRHAELQDHLAEIHRGHTRPR